MLKEGKPRHMQISDWVLDRVQSGDLKPEEKLPSEHEFAEMFEVSRVTVRRALQTLESDAVIYRCQGLGSFVSDRRTPQTLVNLTDFNQDMRRAGMEAASRVVGFSRETAGAKIAETLQIAEGDLVLRIDRLRLGDNEPIAFDITWLPLTYGELLDQANLTERTIYRILEDDHQIPITRGCYRMSAENADALLAHHLGVKSGDALMLIARISYTLGQKPVYYQKRFYRSDKVIYEMRLEREDSAGSGQDALPMKEFLPVFSKEHPHR
jgi:GntR family transcriptional regulator